MKKQPIFLAYFPNIHMSSSNCIFIAIHCAQFHHWMISDGIFYQIEQLSTTRSTIRWYMVYIRWYKYKNIENNDRDILFEILFGTIIPFCYIFY